MGSFDFVRRAKRNNSHETCDWSVCLNVHPRAHTHTQFIYFRLHLNIVTFAYQVITHIHIVCSGLEGIFMVNCHVWLHLNAYRLYNFCFSILFSGLTLVSFCCFVSFFSFFDFDALVRLFNHSVQCVMLKNKWLNKLLRTEKVPSEKKNLMRCMHTLNYAMGFRSWLALLLWNFFIACFFLSLSVSKCGKITRKMEKKSGTHHIKCDAIASFWLLFTPNIIRWCPRARPSFFPCSASSSE